MEPPSTPSTPSTSLPISFPAGNDDFRAARNRCARACRLFNATPEDADPASRVRAWFAIVSPGLPAQAHPPTTHDMTFRDPTLVPAAPFVKPPLHMDYGLRVRVGGSTFINRYCMIMDTPVADVVIGERCNIGPHCAILGVGHPVGVAERTGKRASTGQEVRIGDGVWVGARVTIMGGVTIGDGAVIGACSLVTRSIPPRALAYGVPAEVVRILDEDETVDEAGPSVETLEEALKLTSREATKLTSREATPVPIKTEGGEVVASEEVYQQRPRRDGSQVTMGGRDRDGMTRAEILAMVALALSFLGCFLFVALALVAKQAADASYNPGARDL